jgi:hypothetical protein
MNEPELTTSGDAVIQPSVFTCNSSWHPESALACGRCGAIICPDCLVHTPGGTRCKPCANLKRPPMYVLGTAHYLRAAGITLVLALVLGVVGAIFLPTGGFGFFGILIGFFLGSGIGSLFARAITWATGAKRGIPMQLAAVSGIVGLLLIRFALSGAEFDALRFDLIGPIAGFVAASVAWQQLR